MTMIFTYQDANNVTQSSCNIITQSTTVNASELFYYLKQTLKQAGWTVVRSGDGTASGAVNGVNYGNLDVFTGYGTGAKGMNNASAWFVMQQPGAVAGATRQLLFVRHASYAYTYTISYSYSAGFSGGSWNATTAPTATDSQSLSNTAYVATSYTQYKIHMGADNAAPYGFYMYATPGTSAPVSAIVMDPLAAGSYPAGENDPYIFHFPGTTATSLATGPCGSAIYSETAGTGVLSWLKKAAAGVTPETGSWVLTPGLTYYSSSGTYAVIPSTTSASPYTGKDALFPILYARRSALAAPNGYKGIGTIMKWIGAPRNNSDTISVASSTAKDYIVAGSVALPWNGSTPVV